jgi:NADH:ubiquinone oxidoreductase subunit 3 (subunit A)
MTTLTVLFLFVPVLVAILLLANVLLAPRRPDAEKVTSYECGYAPLLGQTRAPFSIQYYLVGILFLLFDLEILLLYPIAVALSDVTIMGYWVAMLFAGVLTLGFVYEWAKGSLFFTDQRSAITPSTRP